VALVGEEARAEAKGDNGRGPGVPLGLICGSPFAEAGASADDAGADVKLSSGSMCAHAGIGVDNNVGVALGLAVGTAGADADEGVGHNCGVEMPFDGGSEPGLVGGSPDTDTVEGVGDVLPEFELVCREAGISSAECIAAGVSESLRLDVGEEGVGDALRLDDGEEDVDDALRLDAGEDEGVEAEEGIENDVEKGHAGEFRRGAAVTPIGGSIEV